LSTWFELTSKNGGRVYRTRNHVANRRLPIDRILGRKNVIRSLPTAQSFPIQFALKISKENLAAMGERGHKPIRFGKDAAKRCHFSGVIPKARVFTSGPRDLPWHTAGLVKLHHQSLLRFACLLARCARGTEKSRPAQHEKRERRNPALPGFYYHVRSTARRHPPQSPA
jgi:hypothetical protein